MWKSFINSFKSGTKKARLSLVSLGKWTKGRMAAVVGRWNSLPKRTKWWISEGARAAAAGSVAFGLSKLFDTIFSKQNDKDAREMERAGLDPESPNFHAALNRYIYSMRDEAVSQLERVAWRLSASAKYRNDYRPEDIMNFVDAVFLIVRYAPTSEAAAVLITAIKTWLSLTECGLTVQERADNPLLIRHVINSSEDEADPEEVMNDLMVVMALAESGAPLE